MINRINHICFNVFYHSNPNRYLLAKSILNKIDIAEIEDEKLSKNGTACLKVFFIIHKNEFCWKSPFEKLGKVTIFFCSKVINFRLWLPPMPNYDPKIKYPLFGSMVLTIGMIIQVVVYAINLPDTVPTHFDSNGNANSYGSKYSLIGIYIGVYLGLTVLFSILVGVIPTCTNCPFVNIPNKEYWFDPDHPERYKRKWLPKQVSTNILKFQQNKVCPEGRVLVAGGMLCRKNCQFLSLKKNKKNNSSFSYASCKSFCLLYSSWCLK